MATGQYLRRTSLTFIVNGKRRKLSWFGHVNQYAIKNRTTYIDMEQETVVVAEEDRANHGGTTSRNDVVDGHRRRQKSMGHHCRFSVCRSTPATLGRHES